MLKFFRTIRKKLIEQDNVRKYLLYAIGEILLVVVGILIALQVNNWNEGRIEHNLENRYLQRLVTDLNADLESLSNSIESDLRRKDRALFLIRVSDSPELIEEDPSYFIQSIEYAGYTYDPVISDHTFEEIKSSGNLSIIRNEEIRKALSEYYSNRYNRDQYDFIRRDFQLQYLQKKQGILSRQQQIDMGRLSTNVSYTLSEAIKVYQRLQDKPDFIEWLPSVIQSKIRSIETNQGFQNDATRVKTMISNELEK